MNHTLVNPPVDRDKEIHEVSDVFIHARQGDRRGRRRPRREDGRHRLGAVELQLRLLPRQRADQEGGVRALLLRADGPPEHQAALPAVLRVHGRRGRQPVRLPALEPLRRERLGADVRRRADPVGELPDLRQPRDRQHLPPHGVHLAGDAPGLHAPGGQARLPRRRSSSRRSRRRGRSRSAASRPASARSSRGATRSGR